MELKALHSLMSRKGFHYFDGHTNDNENNLYLSFSTMHNGRGDMVEIRIGEMDNDIKFWINSSNIIHRKVSDVMIFSYSKERGKRV